MLFFTFGQFTRVFGIGTQIRGTTMRILTSWGFRKCRTFWVWESPKGSYWASKSTDFENLGLLPKIRGVTKKQHSVNNDRTDLKRIGVLVHPIGYPSYSCRVRKCIFDRVLFFCDTSFSKFEKLKNDWTLTANNSPLKSRTPKKYHIFGILRMWGFRWWYPGYGIVFENFEQFTF